MKHKDEVIFFILLAILFGIFYGLGILITWLDYLLNKSLIDMIFPWNLQWWHIFTFRHWWTWLFVNNISAYLLYYAMICIIVAFVVELLIIWKMAWV